MNGFLNLLAQLFMAALLLVEVSRATRNVKKHYRTMTVVVVLNLFSILVIMVPSAIRILPRSQLSYFTAIVWVHLLFGLIVEVVGLYIVLGWYYRKNCVKYRGYMKPLSVSWIGSIISGIIIYYLLYV